MVNINSILLTNSGINKFSGGGVVSLNLLEALMDFSNVKFIASNQHFKDGKYDDKIPTQCLAGEQYGFQDPFFMDYMCNLLIDQITDHVDLVQTYACPFGISIEKLKRNYHCKVVADIAPHNTDISIAEHIALTKNYPYVQLINDFLWNAYSKHLRLSDKIIVHSHSSAAFLKKKAELTIEPTVIPHGCYISEKTPSYPTEISPGYFGACGIDKGILYLINAWVLCKESEKTQMILGGREMPDFKLAEEHKHYQSRFKILGEAKELVDFYKQISFFVQTSVTEGFGITALEAMSYGRPVILTEGVGVSELITDGKDGFVLPIRDIRGISDKMQWFFDNPGEIKKMGREARKTAEKYSWNLIKKQYVKIYKELFNVQ